MNKVGRIFMFLLLGAVILIPAQSSFAQNGLDLNDYCRDKGWGRATLNGGDTAYDWKCQSGSTYRDMNLNEACQMQYGSGYSAEYRDFNDPYSWYCEGSGGSNDQNNNSSSSSSSTQPSSNTTNNGASPSNNMDGCPSFPEPVSVGGIGRVTPGVSNNIRSGAGTNYSRVGQIPAGRTFNVIGGPTCNGGYRWWQVNYNGQRGWTADGVIGDLWIESTDRHVVIATVTITSRQVASPSASTAPSVEVLQPSDNRFRTAWNYLTGEGISDAIDDFAFFYEIDQAGQVTNTNAVCFVIGVSREEWVVAEYVDYACVMVDIATGNPFAISSMLLQSDHYIDPWLDPINQWTWSTPITCWVTNALNISGPDWCN